MFSDSIDYNCRSFGNLKFIWEYWNNRTRGLSRRDLGTVQTNEYRKIIYLELTTTDNITFRGFTFVVCISVLAQFVCS